MRFDRFSLIAVLTCSLVATGCGGPPDVKVTVQSSAIVTSVRKTLEDFEKTGKMSSAISGLESDINGIKSTDSAKGEKLEKAYRELQGLTKPDDIKAKAKEMIGML